MTQRDASTNTTTMNIEFLQTQQQTAGNYPGCFEYHWITNQPISWGSIRSYARQFIESSMFPLAAYL